MEIIETPIFTSLIEDLLSAEDYRGLQLALALRPRQGALIRGGGGIRKLRWGRRGMGKRGGLRVIYYWVGPEQTIYMLFLYRKTRQSDLTNSQIKVLRQLVREEFE